MNGYELSRNWFDWCFENPEKINPNHSALYFFCIEHCNRLGWKEKFGLPTTMAKEAIGIRSYNTYIKTLNELVEFGFIKMIEKSKNQYSSNIIALSNFDKALNKALDKALIKHTTKQRESTQQSIDSIDKQLNKEQENNLTILHPLQNYIISTLKNVSKLSNQLTYDECVKLMSSYDREKIGNILLQMENKKDLTKKYTSVYLTASSWLKKDFSNKGQNLSNGQPSKMESMVNSAKEALNMIHDEQ